MHEAEHELQITATVLDHMIHVTRRLAIPPQVVFCAHSGRTFIGEKTPSLFRVQTPGPVCIVYPISPHVNNANTARSHDHIRSKRSASRFADHYLKWYMSIIKTSVFKLNHFCCKLGSELFFLDILVNPN